MQWLNQGGRKIGYWQTRLGGSVISGVTLSVTLCSVELSIFELLLLIMLVVTFFYRWQRKHISGCKEMFNFPNTHFDCPFSLSSCWKSTRKCNHECCCQLAYALFLIYTCWMRIFVKIFNVKTFYQASNDRGYGREVSWLHVRGQRWAIK